MNTTSTDNRERALLCAGLSALELTLDDAAIDRLLAYQDLIARWNKVYNLTAVRDVRDMRVQHLLDCLAVVRPLRAAFEVGMSVRVLDVGSGAGLPGIVLAICLPTWQITCVDTVAKKASFIRQVGLELGLSNLSAVHQRVEMMEGQVFDLVTSRAFASLTDFISLTRDRLRPNGRWAAMKARLTEQERQDVPADVAITAVQALQVPDLDAERCLVWMQQVTAEPGGSAAPGDA